MFDHILVLLDGSPLAECVLPHAIAVSRVFQAQITLLRVLERPHDSALSQAIDPLEWQLIKAEARTYLDGVSTQLDDAGLKTKTLLLEGNAAHEIVEFIYRNDINLVILSSHGHSGLSVWNVSSVVQKIILRAFTSTLIVRAYHPEPEDLANVGYRKLMIPLDGSRRAENVLPPTKSLALHFESQILLAHLVFKPEMPSRTRLTPSEVEMMDQIIQRNEKEATQYLEEIRSTLLTGVTTHLHIGMGRSEQLHKLVEQEQIDLVVLNAHGHTCNPNWPFGSLTLSMIAYGTTPLLIIQDLSREEMQSSVAEFALREEKGH